MCYENKHLPTAPVSSSRAIEWSLKTDRTQKSLKLSQFNHVVACRKGHQLSFSLQLLFLSPFFLEGAGPGGGTLVISGWGCAAGTLEPLAYTRAS